jgi:uncharacterized protein YhbP (UPF0306 family)
MTRNPRQLALDYLAGHQVMTLSTIGAEGPWAAAVFFASETFDLFFLSASHTRHAKNMQANPGAAAAIHEDYKDWPQIKGIQLEGQVEKLTGSDRANAIQTYQEKYPFLKKTGSQLAVRLAAVNWYRLAPNRLYFIDNSQGFGHRDQIL